MKNLICVAFLLGCATESVKDSEDRRAREYAIANGYTAKSQNFPQILSKTDEFTGNTFIGHESFIYSSAWCQSHLLFRIFQGKSGPAELIFSFKFSGSSWIFFTEATIINDKGEKREFKFPYSSVDREATSWGVCESAGISVKASDIPQLRILLNPNSVVKLRLSGQNYDDYVISSDDINKMYQVIDYYLAQQKPPIAKPGVKSQNPMLN